MKHLILLLSIISLVGCADGTTTEVRQEAASAASAAAPAINDVVERVIPVLTDRAEARRLSKILESLRTALNAGQLVDAAAMARTAQEEVERYALRTGADAAELDAVSLALARIVGEK